MEQCLICNGCNLHVIGLAQMRFRRKQSRRPFGIVGEQEQSLASFVQTSHRRKVGNVFAQVVVDSGTAFFVGSGGYNPAWFVQGNVKFEPCFNRLAVNPDLIFFNNDWSFGISVNGAIDLYPSRLNQFHGAGTGAITQLGECPRQTSPARTLSKLGYCSRSSAMEL